MLLLLDFGSMDSLAAVERMLNGLADFEPALAAALFDRHRQVRTWSPAIEKLTGFSASEAIGRHASTLFGGSGVNDGQNDLLLASEGRGGWAKSSGLVSRKGGGDFFAEMSVLAVRTATPSVLGYLVLVRELSAGDGVPTSLTRLREAERALENAAGVAHDLNNLMTALLAVSDEHRSVGRVAPPEMIGDVVTRMRLLVQTFLGTVKGLRRPHVLVSVNEAVTNTLRLVQLVAFRENLDVVVRLDPGCRPVLADSLAIEEAILNVVTNACHASSPGAEIFVETKTIQLSERSGGRGHRLPPGTYVVLSVRDKGCGMSDRVLSHLFEPFFTTRASSHGTGLGLFGARRLANDLGGSLLVHSTEGQGTLVEIYLPAAELPRAVSVK